jgi:hypothetical protein
MLYYCCTTAQHAEEIVLSGFPSDQFVPVTETSPYLHSGVSATHAVVMLGLPVDLHLYDYFAHTNRQGAKEYLVLGSALNRCQRAVWPR